MDDEFLIIGAGGEGNEVADAAVALDGGICCDPGIFRFSEEGVSAKDVFRQVIPAIEVCIRFFSPDSRFQCRVSKDLWSESDRQPVFPGIDNDINAGGEGTSIRIH